MPQPKLRPEPSRWQRLFEVAAPAMLFTMLIYITLQYGSLPDRIPIHFDLYGKPNGWGHKVTIWGLPVIAVGIYVLLRLVSRYPHNLNYAVKITEENVARQYRLAMALMAYINLISMTLLLSVSYSIIAAAKAGGGKLDIGFFVSLGLLFGGIAYYFVLASRER